MTGTAGRRERGTLARPDATLYYEVTGSGPPLVFAHGLGGGHLSWWQQVPHFARDYTCVTFSHRGFAPSTAAAEPDPDAYADDLAALADHLGLDRFALVCQSMGGWTGLDLALDEPSRVTALVLACTSGRIDFGQLQGPVAADLAAWRAEAEATLARYAADGIHPACGARLAAEQPALHFLYREIDDLTPAATKAAVRRRLMATRCLSPDRLAALTMPVLFINGDEDMVFPAAAAPALAALIPGARAERIAAAGHSVYFERPARFNALVAAFLAAGAIGSAPRS